MDGLSLAVRDAMNLLCGLKPPDPMVFSSGLFSLLAALLLAALLLPSESFAQQPVKPLPRRGGCPSDYTTWDEYCVPSDYARGAIERIGSYCPSGFETQGAFCLSFPKGREAIPKIGYSCPPDWDPSGSYCLRR